MPTGTQSSLQRPLLRRLWTERLIQREARLIDTGLLTSAPFIAPIYPPSAIELRRREAYLLGMPNVLHWTLVFSASSLEHLADRDIATGEVAEAVFGYYGPALVRKSGRGQRLRWLVIAPLGGGELLSCVLRQAMPRDLTAEGAFVVPATGVPEEPGEFSASMRFCVSARLSAADEVRSYRAWRRHKGGS